VKEMKLENENPRLNQDSISLGAPAPNEVSSFDRFVNGLEKVIFTLNNVLHSVSSIILFLLMFLTTADVFGRYFFNKPIIGTYELTGLALAIMIFFSLGMAQIKKDHIEIDFLTNKLSVRTQSLLYAVSALILFVLVALTTWQLFNYANRIMIGNETSGDLGLPLYIFVYLTAIGAICFSMTFLLDFIKSLVKVVKK
jgi:TRAP-type transport system small permease protein